MTVDVLPRQQPGAQSVSTSKLAIADGDIHPRAAGKSVGGVSTSLFPYMEKRWVEHFHEFSLTYRQPWEKGAAYPKNQPQASRRDAWPPGGGGPGSDLAFMQAQHLDPNNVTLGILNPLGAGQGAISPDASAAVARAVNDWQVAEWTSRDRRLRGSVVVPYEDAAASVKEIERCAPNPDFAQVLLLSRTAEPLGQRRYWPIYEAAAAAGLPIGVHAFGNGGWPNTAGGWGSYYIEEMVGHAQAQQALLISMILEGVFETYPTLKLVLIEGGLAWAAALGWRMDAQWRKLKRELPRLKKAPSEYMRTNVWFTTQPIEEPDPRTQLAEVFDWIGWDRVLFATDYPHWDFDDPAHALPMKMTEAQRQAVFRGNAEGVYRGR
ncbi:amidohydrolase family protein [Rhodopila sp.]|uniref:amidohydrolase family protein n=1 Tax=Rhodopila sp. TaxID=2480087 RepID=UPI002BDD1C5C|nr:amidohydrolase family protein [Rhodopila sp.]HVZ08551.1 amidohydrolase family protein [Rhodopila sp.]